MRVRHAAACALIAGASAFSVQPLPARHRHGVARHAATIIEADADVAACLAEPMRREPSAHDTATGRDKDRVKIFDTTLRDGEQSPGCTLNIEEKLAVARQLGQLNVDVIEAGFPIASKGDFEAVERIAKSVGCGDDPPIICGLSRAMTKDIETCAAAVKGAKFPRIHTFIATSDIHMESKLNKSREQVLDITREMVGLAASLVDDVEFSGEDALRSDPDFLCEVYSVAIEAGATTINVPDTVGYTTPAEFYSLVRAIRNNVRGIEKATISVHGHDDLGMAVANFMAAIQAGARQVECTVNGIGERAGNAALEEVVMALQVRKSFYNPSFGRPADSEQPLTGINTREISTSSRLVSSLTGMVVQPNKAIVGANAFSHESGIHQDGMLKNKLTYEIMDAESVGLEAGLLVLGKHSGRHAFRSRLLELGFDLDQADINSAFIRFKDLADKKKEITNMDLESIVAEEYTSTVKDRYKLLELQVVCGVARPTATVTIYDDESRDETTVAAIGTGPVDASFNAIMTVAGVSKVKLLEYTVSSVTAGIDALGEVTVRLKDTSTDRIFFGRSANTDVVFASAQAYLNALERLRQARGQEAPVHPQFGKA